MVSGESPFDWEVDLDGAIPQRARRSRETTCTSNVGALDLSASAGPTAEADSGGILGAKIKVSGEGPWVAGA